LHIVGIESDASKVQTARKALDAAGVYGARVVIDQGDPSTLPYSNYFANLIVSDSLLLTGKIPGDANRLARHLKPCGGVICLGVPAGSVAPPPWRGRPARASRGHPGLAPSGDDVSDTSNAQGQDTLATKEQGRDALATTSAGDLADWLSQLRLGRCRISQTNGLWAILKRGPLPGAGQWTHQYANAGNVTCSNDRIVSGPLGLLWFGEPGPAPMVNRHDAAAAPLVVNGKTFIQGENTVMAQDSYNGTLLWQRDIPGAVRTRLKAKECGNLAASDDSFFVALPDQCLRLDAETGQTVATYPLPTKAGDKSSQWGFLAYVDGILYGSGMTRVGVSDRVFAIESCSGELLWQYAAKNIGNLTLALGDGWLFFIDSSLTREQRDELLRQDKSRLASLKGQEAKQAEEAMKKLDVRLAVALDAKTGGKLWETPVDVTDCSNVGIAAGDLMAIYNDGVLVLCGANANGHYWKQFLSGQFSERRLVALSGRTGEKLWARDANYRHRPIVIGDMIVAEPWAYDLKTGQQRTRPNPISGVEAPWQFLRPGHHCGALSACPQMLLMRSGFTAYYDLHDDSGIRHFAGHRAGCWINTIPADGLVLQPEASAGCICLFPLMCSVALEPRSDHYRWGIYSAKGSNTPVQHLAVNLGASGDLRARRGDPLWSPEGRYGDLPLLWLAYPRPKLPADRAAMGFALDLKVEFFPGGEYVSHARSEYRLQAAHDRVNAELQTLELECPVRSSFAQGIKRCTLPLRGDTDGPGEYTIRLYFPPVANSGVSKATFDIRLQGNIVAKAFDPGQAPQGASLELTGIRVDRNLELEFLRPDEKTMPALGGFDATCTSSS
jgi:outer membrane protein assembly factor BamB